MGLIPGLGTFLGVKWQPIPVFLPGKSHGQRSLAGYSPWGHKESDTTEPLGTHIVLINLLIYVDFLAIAYKGSAEDKGPEVLEFSGTCFASSLRVAEALILPACGSWGKAWVYRVCFFIFKRELASAPLLVTLRPDYHHKFLCVL